MPNIEVPDELWNEIIAQQARFNFATQIDFLEFCLNVVQSRYWPAVSAIVTRNNAEILLVGNDYFCFLFYFIHSIYTCVAGMLTEWSLAVKYNWYKNMLLIVYREPYSIVSGLNYYMLS